jgi:uncharacterized low-complexity protein
MKKLLVLLSALALTFTLATAEGKCGDSKKSEMKCESGKCASDKNKTKKCNGANCDSGKKEAPIIGKCGQGKCG